MATESNPPPSLASPNSASGLPASPISPSPTSSPPSSQPSSGWGRSFWQPVWEFGKEHPFALAVIVGGILYCGYNIEVSTLGQNFRMFPSNKAKDEHRGNTHQKDSRFFKQVTGPAESKTNDNRFEKGSDVTIKIGGTSRQSKS